MTALLIALAHGIPIVLARLVLGSRIAVLAAAIVMGIVAVAMGSASFLALDLLVIVVVTFLCLS